MEKKAKRVFDKEFKINTVKLILSKEKKIAELARELGIAENTLHLWKTKYLKDLKDAFPGKGIFEEIRAGESGTERRKGYIKKSTRHIFKVTEDKYNFVEVSRSEYRIKRICRAIEVSESGYNSWRRGEGKKRKTEDKQLTEEIKWIFEKNKSRYGSPRIEKELRKKGVKTSPKRVARLMQENGLKARTKRKYRATTNSKHNLPVAKNLLKQDFTVAELDKIWTSDITGIWTSEGWLYLAVVLDICSRHLIGWKTSNYLGKELVIGALNKALKDRKPLGGLIFHSDQGVQYASYEVRKILEIHNITQSMSNRGNCYDNAITETFFHTLKTELIYGTSYGTRQEVELDLFEYIEVYYNRQRIHSSLNYLSPVEFEEQFFINKTLS